MVIGHDIRRAIKYACYSKDVTRKWRILHAHLLRLIHRVLCRNVSTNIFFYSTDCFISQFCLAESTYKNLCTACDNPVSCYNDDKYHGREGALLCLTDDVGDVAWVRLDDTLVHFKVIVVNSTGDLSSKRRCNNSGRANLACQSKKWRTVARFTILTSAVAWCRTRRLTSGITTICVRTAAPGRSSTTSLASGYRNPGRSSWLVRKFAYVSPRERNTSSLRRRRSSKNARLKTDYLTRQIAEKVAHTMNLLKNITFGWETSVLQLMESYHISPVSTENLETPEDYLGRCNVYAIREV